MKNQIKSLFAQFSNNAKLVTIDELNRILSETVILEGMPCFANVIQLTSPKLNKKDRKTGIQFEGNIQKLSQVSIILNSKYERALEIQLEKEEKSLESYIKGKNSMPLLKGENNEFYGTFYGKGVLEYRPNINPKNFPTTYWFLNNEIVEKSDLPDVLPIENKATNQGTEKEIFWRKLYTSNIVQISLNGNVYQTI